MLSLSALLILTSFNCQSIFGIAELVFVIVNWLIIPTVLVVVVEATIPPITPVPSEEIVWSSEPNKVKTPAPTAELPTDMSNLPEDTISMLWPTFNDFPVVPL